MTHLALLSQRRRTLALVLAAPLVMMAPPAHATRMVHRNADELVRLADRIFVGRCVSSERVAVESGLDFQQYEFAVEDGIVGPNTGALVRFRQLAPPEGGIAVGMPSYQVGERYLLFLVADGPLGLTSPVGLGQGAFRLFETDRGPLLANVFGNESLFRGMGLDIRPGGRIGLTAVASDAGRARGALRAQELLPLVRDLAARRGTRP
jgi:hypothetical protein